MREPDETMKAIDRHRGIIDAYIAASMGLPTTHSVCIDDKERLFWVDTDRELADALGLIPPVLPSEHPHLNPCGVAW